MDSNLLLLFLIGEIDVDEIDRKKRVQIYDKDDYYALKTFIQKFVRLYTTPNIITEVSNLLGRKPKFGSVYDIALSNFIVSSMESYVPSEQASNDPFFASFDIADTVSKVLAARGKLLLTDDYQLANHMDTAGLPVVNFNHIRPLL
ncbi:MAG: hypothetical protein U5L06_10195 [Rhodovibrio sp.]|nr:hypothetical protein [Rhodovibrio sp.]